MSRAIENCALRSLSDVGISIQKDGRQSFFGHDTNYKIVHSAAFSDYILYSVSYQNKDWWGPACQFLFSYDTGTKMLRHVFPWHASNDCARRFDCWIGADVYLGSVN